MLLRLPKLASVTILLYDVTRLASTCAAGLAWLAASKQVNREGLG